MRLAQAPPQYDARDQAQVRQALQDADGFNVKSNAAQDFLLLKSPNGTVYKLSVSNAGAAVFTAY